MQRWRKTSFQVEETEGAQPWAQMELTGNPGSPGKPSGPCETPKTKHFQDQQEHRAPAPSQGLSLLPVEDLVVLLPHFAEDAESGREGSLQPHS